MTANDFSLGAIILAAGASSRMGRPKMLLPWGASTVIGHLIAQWRDAGATQIAVVCAEKNHSVDEELDRIGFPRDQRILNPEPALGMFSSIQCAARWTAWKPGLTHWAIVLGDQPHLTRETLHAVVEFAALHPHNVCQPARSGRPRHPVFLPRDILGQLARTNSQTMKEFLQAHAAQVRLLESDDAGLDIDLDTPEDYERAARL
jgi:molybdenum cofactor cytidylyltransferase